MPNENENQQPPAPPPAVDSTALQTRLAEMEKQMKANETAWQNKEHQYITAVNQLAERIGPNDEPEPSPEPDPSMLAAMQRQLAPLEARLSATQDALDGQSFMQTASAMGATSQQVSEAEQQYQNWRQSGLSTVDGRGNRRTPTRREALAFVLGNSTIAGALKEAPTRNAAALREQLLGTAAFEVGSGTQGPVRRAKGYSFDELEQLPLGDRIKKREELLDKDGF